MLVNPENVFEIMRAVHRVLVDQGLRDKLKQRGYEQATKFSWDASARQILAAYRDVAAQPTEKSPVHEPEVGERVGDS
jgi:glycosyltransferase involved in cell wall biosynthesis